MAQSVPSFHSVDKSSPDSPITHLLLRWTDGEREAAEHLMPLVYDELRQIAHRVFRQERRDHTLQATALVHEVYLKLTKRTDVRWESRTQFYGLAACMMRRALVDHSREREYLKRGGGQEKVALDEARDTVELRPESLIALDDALKDLARHDAQKALIVELRFFGGLSVDQTAECVGLSPRSVAREWRVARAQLYRALDTETRHAL